MPRKKTEAGQALGRAIREVRQERGFSQEAFAAHAGIDRSYYGRIERGEFSISLTTAMRLTRALETSLSNLAKRAGL